MTLGGFIVAALIVKVILFLVFLKTPGLASRTFDLFLRAFFEYRDIPKPEGLYLRRFFITPRAWLGFDYARGRSRWPRLLGWVLVKYRKIFVHHILLSDNRTPHDHPWPFTTIILAGEYIEHIGVRDGFQRRGRRGSVLNNGAGHIHYLEIVRPVWSLVFAGESKRVWGFWSHDEERGSSWQDWRSYLNLPRVPTAREDEIDPTMYPDASFDDFFSRDGNPRNENDRYGRLDRKPRFKDEVTISRTTAEDAAAIPITVEDEPTTKKIVSVGPFSDELN